MVHLILGFVPLVIKCASPYLNFGREMIFAKYEVQMYKHFFLKALHHPYYECLSDRPILTVHFVHDFHFE